MTSFATGAEGLALGLLIARVVLGGLIAAHGTQKLFGWFGGHGLAGTGGYFEMLGFRPGRHFAAAAATTEVLGGLLIALGLLGPIGPALVLAVMIVAAVTVHLDHGLFAQGGGMEVPILYGTAAVALAFTGFGAISLDAATGLGEAPVALSSAMVALGALGAMGMLLIRRPEQQAVKA